MKPPSSFPAHILTGLLFGITTLAVFLISGSFAATGSFSTVSTKSSTVKNIYPGVGYRVESNGDNSGNNLVIIYTADYDDIKVYLQMSADGRIQVVNSDGEAKGIMFWKDGELSCSPAGAIR